MKWFYNLRISAKLAFTFFLLLALTCVLGVFALIQIQKVNQSTTDISQNWLPSIQNVLEMEVEIGHMRANQLLRLTSSDAQDAARFGKAFSEAVTLFEEKAKAYEALVTSPEEKAQYDRLKQAFAQYKAVQEKVIQSNASGQEQEALKLMRGDGARYYGEVAVAADKLVAINKEGGKHATLSADKVYSSSLWLIVGILAACIVLGIVLATWLARIVATPLRQAVHVASCVAQGDLTVQIEAQSKDETGQLMASLKAMNAGLQRVVSQVRNGTETISTAADQIATGNTDLSHRTEEQAGSLEQTASAMEELTATVKQNADNAREASRLAASASQVAAEGGSVVNQVVETMGSINDSSQKVVDIISVIDGIAFQTNILALNAAVEAARAGEQGRGFAVVASEVRSLAQRSSTAAKEIKALIGNSVEKVETGTRLVAQAGATMSDIVASVRQVSNIVEEISSASQEQSTGIASVNDAIGRIDETTSQNAALVEQAAAAAQSLREQATHLTGVVGIFKLEPGQDGAAAQVAPRAAVRPALKPVRAAPAVGGGAPKPVREPLRSIPAPRPEPRLAASGADGGDWEHF
jgi:methyl-accepting chemotaxis protein